MPRECGNTDPAKAMLELANANERLFKEVVELKLEINLHKDTINTLVTETIGDMHTVIKELGQENKDLKKAIEALQADNKELEADNQMLERQRNKWFEKCQQIEQERDNYLRQLRGECPSCGSPNWDKVTGCSLCSLGPEDLT